ncbi:hypothetical protein GCM10025868_05640 [Angustibacter aerolatus]|uniref:Uncharacterized protein n=1 Tax=Angustibacter aerolatus TaxID=1162965 RepID=A0ABQ6JD04_9ACTN|nr:hypothetical protein GCM10025868_05640 [Angustibacter aerolatus]
MLGAEHSTFTVQAMAPAGVPCVIRSVEDPLFGPVLEFGVDGAPTEPAGRRRAPDAAAARGGRRRPGALDRRGPAALRAPRRRAGRHRGARGRRHPGRAARRPACPRWPSLVLDPVLAAPSGVAVLGARVRLAPPPGRTDDDIRRLPD